MTMKVSRFWSFFNLTKAPATGCPDASLTTPVTVPLFCAEATDATPNSAAPAAMPTASVRVTYLRDMWLTSLVARRITKDDLFFGPRRQQSLESNAVAKAVRGGPRIFQTTGGNIVIPTWHHRVERSDIVGRESPDDTC